MTKKKAPAVEEASPATKEHVAALIAERDRFAARFVDRVPPGVQRRLDRINEAINALTPGQSP